MDLSDIVESVTGSKSEPLKSTGGKIHTFKHPPKAFHTGMMDCGYQKLPNMSYVHRSTDGKTEHHIHHYSDGINTVKVSHMYKGGKAEGYKGSLIEHHESSHGAQQHTEGLQLIHVPHGHLTPGEAEEVLKGSRFVPPYQQANLNQ